MEQSCGPWQLDLPLKLRQFPLVGFSGQQAPWSAHIVQQGRKNLAPCQNHLKSLSFKVHPINSLHSEATLCSYRETEIPKYIESIFIFPFSPHFIQSQILQGHSSINPMPALLAGQDTGLQLTKCPPDPGHLWVALPYQYHRSPRGQARSCTPNYSACHSSERKAVLPSFFVFFFLILF